MTIETVTKTEEGVKTDSPTVQPEKGKEGAEKVESPTTGLKPEELPKEVPPVHKHAKAEDRINFLTKKRREAEAVLAEKEQTIKQLESELEKSKLTAIPRPKRDAFETDEAYQEAYEQFVEKKLELRLTEREAKRQEVAIKTEYEQAWTPFQEAAGKLDEEQYPDLDQAILGDGVLYSNLSREFVRTSPVGPQLAYHFYQHPDIAEKVAKMPVYEQTQALISIQSELVKASESKTVTKAPAPISPVGGSGGIVEKNPDKMTPEEWMQWRKTNKKVR